MNKLGKVVASVEARMSSTRLPGKVLLPVLNKPILYYLVERLRAVSLIDEIVLATTVNAQDDVLESYAYENNIRCYRGSEDDVIRRVIEAVKSVNGTTVVEITGDCPIIDPELVSQVISLYEYNDVKYASNGVIRSYPDGMDVSVFSLDTLVKSEKLCLSDLHREHVAMTIVQNSSLFPSVNLVAPPNLHYPQLGLTLDETQDFKLIKHIIEALYLTKPLFGCYDIITFLQQRPDLLEINSNVKRKGFT